MAARNMGNHGGLPLQFSRKIESVFICVYLGPTKFILGYGSAALVSPGLIFASDFWGGKIRIDPLHFIPYYRPQNRKLPLLGPLKALLIQVFWVIFPLTVRSPCYYKIRTTEFSGTWKGESHE